MRWLQPSDLQAVLSVGLSLQSGGWALPHQLPLNRSNATEVELVNITQTDKNPGSFLTVDVKIPSTSTASRRILVAGAGARPDDARRRSHSSCFEQHSGAPTCVYIQTDDRSYRVSGFPS